MTLDLLDPALGLQPQPLEERHRPGRDLLLGEERVELQCQRLPVEMPAGDDLAALGLRALAGATLATLLTGALAGVFYHGQRGLLGL